MTQVSFVSVHQPSDGLAIQGSDSEAASPYRGRAPADHGTPRSRRSEARPGKGFLEAINKSRSWGYLGIRAWVGSGTRVDRDNWMHLLSNESVEFAQRVPAILSVCRRAEPFEAADPPPPDNVCKCLVHCFLRHGEADLSEKFLPTFLLQLALQEKNQIFSS
jgi:hypothetical protein